MAQYVQTRRVDASEDTFDNEYRKKKSLPQINYTKVPDFTLSDESKHVIKSILDAKTAETDGVLSIDELGDCLEAFGFNADDEDVTFLQKHFDDNGDGELEVKELINNLDVINWHCFHGKDLMREFMKIDTDGDGVIRYPEMLKVLTTRGPNPLPPIEARRMLDILARKFDANFDGKFSYSEFVKIYMSDVLPYKDTLGQPRTSDDESDTKKKSSKDLKKRKTTVTKKKSETAATSSSTTHSRSGATSAKAPSRKPSSMSSSSTSSNKTSSIKPPSSKPKVPSAKSQKRTSSTTGK